jgi:hypothetical protein
LSGLVGGPALDPAFFAGIEGSARVVALDALAIRLDGALLVKPYSIREGCVFSPCDTRTLNALASVGATAETSPMRRSSFRPYATLSVGVTQTRYDGGALDGHRVGKDLGPVYAYAGIGGGVQIGAASVEVRVSHFSPGGNDLAGYAAGIGIRRTW